MGNQEKQDVSESTAEEKSAEDIKKEESESSNKTEEMQKALDEANDKYVRLYADFENFKKITAKNKEELLKHANDGLMSDILTVIDHLELALQHSAGDETSSSLAEGVELTLKELKNVLEKHGLVTIEALNRPFDPLVHHAMSQIESDDVDENTVVKEFRKGYMLKDRVIRASMVGVSKKPGRADESDAAESQNGTNTDEQ